MILQIIEPGEDLVMTRFLLILIAAAKSITIELHFVTDLPLIKTYTQIVQYH